MIFIMFWYVTMRLGLHNAIFSAIFCGRFRSEWRRFFFLRVYTAIFSFHFCRWFGVGEKLSLSRSIFPSEFSSSVGNVGTALSDLLCSTLNIYAHHCDFTWTSCPFSAKTSGEKIATKHIDAAPFVSVLPASSVESSADTCGKKIAMCSPSLRRMEIFEIFSHCRCASVLGWNQDCVITIVCST